MADKIISDNFIYCARCWIYWDSKIHKSCPCCEYAQKIIEFLDEKEKSNNGQIKKG